MGKGRSSPSCWPRGALTFRCFTIVECHTAKPISLVDGLARQVAVVEATLGGTLRDGDQGVLFMGDNNTTRPKQR
jgi:hypothetical protein